MIDDMTRRRFQMTVWDYYRAHGRHDLPWRQPEADGSFNPYHILVSEIMLQQTQVGRVLPKYQEFLTRFPTVISLAAAPLGEVLRSWSGLGYNRRAKFLRLAAVAIVERHDGIMPRDLPELRKLPGVGPGTAGALLAYVFNQPVVFVETNIRTVFFHHFFVDQADGITDREILALMAETLDLEHPREWYWALMDYGSHLKQSVGNLNVRGHGYTRQSQFKGSRRQLRGQVLRLLGDERRSLAELRQAADDERLKAVLDDLLTEGLVVRRGRYYQL